MKIPFPLILSLLTVAALAASIGCVPPHTAIAPNNQSVEADCATRLDLSEFGDEVVARVEGALAVGSVVQTAAMPAYLKGAPARAARFRAIAQSKTTRFGEGIGNIVNAKWKSVPYDLLDEYGAAWNAAWEECSKQPQKRDLCARMSASAEGIAQAKRDGLAPAVIKHLDHALRVATSMQATSGPQTKSEGGSTNDESSTVDKPANAAFAQCSDAVLPTPPLVVAEDAAPRSLVARVNVAMGSLGHKVQYTGSAFVLVTKSAPINRVFAVTNAHVVGFADHVSLVFGDGRAMASVPIILVDADHDLAVIELPNDSFAGGVDLANDLVKELSDVVSVGFPEGSYQIATGAVTNNELSRPAIFGPVAFVQHSAPIHFGSSGGPLLDKAHRVVGVNTILRSDRENTAFAIPTSRVSALITEVSGTPRAIDAEEHRQACLAALLGSKAREGQVANNLLTPLLTEALYDSWSDEGSSKWSDPLQAGGTQLANVLATVSYGEACAASKRLSDRAYEFELRTYTGTKIFLRTGVSRGAVGITRVEVEESQAKPSKLILKK